MCIIWIMFSWLNKDTTTTTTTTTSELCRSSLILQVNGHIEQSPSSCWNMENPVRRTDSESESAAASCRVKLNRGSDQRRRTRRRSKEMKDFFYVLRLKRRTTQLKTEAGFCRFCVIKAQFNRKEAERWIFEFLPSGAVVFCWMERNAVDTPTFHQPITHTHTDSLHEAPHASNTRDLNAWLIGLTHI